MLEDISNPFHQVVNRPTRPSHAGDRAAPRRVVSVPGPTGPRDADGMAEGQPSSAEPAPATRIVAAPGPGEVAPPRWWASNARSSVDPDRPAE
jgi:hypothetical protein